MPDPVTYSVTASADGFESDTLLRLTVDDVAEIGIDFKLTSSGDGNGGGNGGGGPPSCVPKRFC